MFIMAIVDTFDTSVLSAKLLEWKDSWFPWVLRQGITMSAGVVPIKMTQIIEKNFFVLTNFYV